MCLGLDPTIQMYPGDADYQDVLLDLGVPVGPVSAVTHSSVETPVDALAEILDDLGVPPVQDVEDVVKADAEFDEEDDWSDEDDWEDDVYADADDTEEFESAAPTFETAGLSPEEILYDMFG